MLKTAAIFGIIAGIILVFSFYLTVPSEGEIDFTKGETVGFSVMIIALSLTFFAIRSVRNKTNGSFTFGQGFRAGLTTVLIASAIYIAGWLFFYEKGGENFMQQYRDFSVAQIESNPGLNEEAKTIQITEMDKGFETYRESVFVRILYTFVEIFPIGFLIATISALLLRKKQPASNS